MNSNPYKTNFWYHILFLVACTLLVSFNTQTSQKNSIDLAVKKIHYKKTLPPNGIFLTRDLKYTRYTLKDNYIYRRKRRQLRWSKIRKGLSFIETINKNPKEWAVLQNYKNKNGRPPLALNAIVDTLRSQDRLRHNRSQGIPLFKEEQDKRPLYYGLDGWIVQIKARSKKFCKAYTPELKKEFVIPTKYITPFSDSCRIRQAVFVNRKHQTIVSLEQTEPAHWSIRSINPCTTGINRLPTHYPTPLGTFAVLQKKRFMYYLVDDTEEDEIAGECPYATRFSGGAHIHGLATVYPNKEVVEYSRTLGTRPRSHMCVRNATSHAEFVYKFTKTMQSLIFVIE